MLNIRDYTEPEEFAASAKHPYLPQHPFRLLMTGASGCGKTNLLLNFIYDYLDFDNLYICAKDIHEPKYSKLVDKYTMFDGVELKKLRMKYHEEKTKELTEMYKRFKKETLFTSDLEDFITVDDLDPSTKNLVVFDDCVTERKQKPIEDLFIRGRKKNASIIYLSQSYYATPINIRKNCNYFIFFKIQPRDIQQILREVDGSLSKEEFKALYEHSTRNKYDFFMIDLINPDIRYRCNFKPWKRK